jgi:hypothetical protein
MSSSRRRGDEEGVKARQRASRPPTLEPSKIGLLSRQRCVTILSWWPTNRGREEGTDRGEGKPEEGRAAARRARTNAEGSARQSAEG